MRRGRRPKGPGLVDGLSGSSEAKRRLTVILETIAGDRPVKEAARELGMNEAAFHKLRARTLSEAVEGLEPRARGRPPERAEEEEGQLDLIRKENEELKIELEAARIREEIAIAMPYLARRALKKR